MKIQIQGIAMFALLWALAMAGCTQNTKNIPPPVPISGKMTSFVEVVAFTPTPVQGYGLVAGLSGTGSVECPPQIRNYLKQYILTQLPKDSSVTADQLLHSSNTAAVKIEGIMPAIASKGDTFDLRITPVPGTQTTSFAWGRLYTANLRFGAASKTVATAQGPVFLDIIGTPDPTTGYILGGGSVSETYEVALALYKSDFRTANIIRNRINERFGDGTVITSSAGVIHVRIPQKYILQKARFVALLKELYLNENPQQEALRAEQLIRDLGDNEKGFAAEIAVEAIGRTQESKVVAALASDDPQTKFRAARCLLYFGNDQGLGVLRQVAMNPDSPYRAEAIETIAVGAKRNDAVSILKQFLASDDLKVRLAAYEHLRRLDASSISTVRVAGDFEVDQVFSSGPRMVYVYRSGKPRIVLFGAPLAANPNIFIESTDGTAILNSREGDKFVNIIRRHPNRNSVLGPVKSSFDVLDIIGTLSTPPTNDPKKTVRLGLGLPYADTIAILNTMCAKGAISADFAAGPMPIFKSETQTNVMKSPPQDR